MALLKCKALMRWLLLLVQHIYCYPTIVLWCLTFTLLKHRWPALFMTAVDTLYSWIVAAITWYSWSAGYDIVEVGDDITRCLGDRNLVLVNHQSAADILVLMATFTTKPGRVSTIMWTMENTFKYTHFGLISNFRKDFFFLIPRDKRLLSLVQLKQHMRDVFLPLKRKLLVVFPEGGFLKTRRLRSQKYALENHLPVFNHVCLPRLGAMEAILSACNSTENISPSDNTSDTITKLPSEDDRLKWILDVTIAYEDGKPLEITTIIGGTRKPCQTTLFYRLYPADQVPTEPAQMTTWLYTRWQEKEQILAKFYETGNIPVSEFCANPVPPRKVVQHPTDYILFNLFFIISSYFHYRAFSFLINAIW